MFVFRLKAYIEEEVQKRLRQMNLQNADNNNGLSLSSESLEVAIHFRLLTDAVAIVTWGSQLRGS